MKLITLCKCLSSSQELQSCCSVLDQLGIKAPVLKSYYFIEISTVFNKYYYTLHTEYSLTIGSQSEISTSFTSQVVRHIQQI